MRCGSGAPSKASAKPLVPRARPCFSRRLHLSAVREALGDEAFTAAWAEGLEMTPDVAIAYALSDDDA